MDEITPREPSDVKRYYVFCESPDTLQNLLNSVGYYDLKEAFIIPGEKPVVCVIMENPDEKTRIKLEALKKKTKETTSHLLETTGKALESLAKRLES